jgi:hypothetical protein
MCEAAFSMFTTPYSPAIPAASTTAMHGHAEHMESSSWLCARRTNHRSSEEPYDEIGVEVCRNVQKCACGRGYLHAADVSSFCTLTAGVVGQMIYCTDNGGY